MESNLTSVALAILGVLFALGAIFGCILAFANKKFAVDINPLIHMVEDVLPKGQCGSCGFPGCMAYAEAVVLDSEVSPSLCIPGKEEVAKQVAELTGKTMAKIEPRIAQVRCAGTYSKAIRSNEYCGVDDCVAANLIFGGDKACKYGCLGLGSCAKACPFGAITMSPEGLPIVSPEKCTGCGVCESTCPKKVISMMPLGAPVRVNCNSHDRGPQAKKACSAACIGCTLCMKNCPYEAIKMDNNLAVIDEHVCLEKCSNPVCLEKCPTGAIKPAIVGILPGTEN